MAFIFVHIDCLPSKGLFRFIFPTNRQRHLFPRILTHSVFSSALLSLCRPAAERELGLSRCAFYERSVSVHAFASLKGGRCFLFHKPPRGSSTKVRRLFDGQGGCQEGVQLREPELGGAFRARALLFESL